MATTNATAIAQAQGEWQLYSSAVPGTPIKSGDFTPGQNSFTFEVTAEEMLATLGLTFATASPGSYYFPLCARLNICGAEYTTKCPEGQSVTVVVGSNVVAPSSSSSSSSASGASSSSGSSVVAINYEAAQQQWLEYGTVITGVVKLSTGELSAVNTYNRNASFCSGAGAPTVCRLWDENLSTSFTLMASLQAGYGYFIELRPNASAGAPVRGVRWSPVGLSSFYNVKLEYQYRAYGTTGPWQTASTTLTDSGATYYTYAFPANVEILSVRFIASESYSGGAVQIGLREMDLQFFISGGSSSSSSATLPTIDWTAAKQTWLGSGLVLAGTCQVKHNGTFVTEEASTNFTGPVYNYQNWRRSLCPVAGPTYCVLFDGNENTGWSMNASMLNTATELQGYGVEVRPADDNGELGVPALGLAYRFDDLPAGGENVSNPPRIYVSYQYRAYGSNNSWQSQFFAVASRSTNERYRYIYFQPNSEVRKIRIMQMSPVKNMSNVAITYHTQLFYLNSLDLYFFWNEIP